MLYTALTKKAMRIAYEAHKDQIDKSGVPYIFHPIHLAEQCTDEYTCTAALLHDVVEDCEGYDFERLRSMGIPEDVVDALRLLTHDDAVPYMDYVKEIKKNAIATKVKCLDLMHNMDESRLDENVDEKILVRLQNKRKIYKEAFDYLNQ